MWDEDNVDCTWAVDDVEDYANAHDIHMITDAQYFVPEAESESESEESEVPGLKCWKIC